MPEAIVLGGGIAGLSCAVALADSALAVTVLERDATLGGRARSWADPVTGDAVDIGPHVVPSGYANMLAFLERLGTRERITWQPGKVLTIASKPHPVPLRDHPLPPPLSLVSSMLRAPGLHASILCQVANDETRWHQDATRVRLLEAGDDFEQRRLAGPVWRQ